MASESGEPDLRPAFFGLGIVGGFLGVLIIAFAALIWAIDGDYVTWPRTAQDQSANQAVVGEQVAMAAGCTGCHSVDGSARTGPTWQGLSGADRVFRTGETAVATAAYLRRSIVEPAVEVVDGFNGGIMPANYTGSLTPSEIDAIVAYIETLATEPVAAGSS